MAWEGGKFNPGDVITASMMNELVRGNYEVITYVRCDYCRREQAMPRDGRCTGCGAPVEKTK